MSGRPSRSYTHSLLSQRATSTHSHTGGAALSAAFHTSVDSRMAFEESLREDFRFRAVATVVLRLLPPNGHSPLKSCGKHWQVQNDAAKVTKGVLTRRRHVRFQSPMIRATKWSAQLLQDSSYIYLFNFFLDITNAAFITSNVLT